ncbi:arginase family protein [Mesorhizobium sp. M8A.F.Ca.ET.057.01.1.1]|uniref:arginase family protein n=1 Tax=Mesorhizobium sp. M8A.F.Ca.ET.057.01.1.1 TaxID=2493679 RepID=UPI001ABFF670|nr:arginase family protein [Mesorhizobium sp. M8A.F.Ca.ET.057.01.1.1]
MNQRIVGQFSTQYGRLQAEKRPGPGGLDIAIAGVPFDQGTFFDSVGQRLGPDQARAFSKRLWQADELTGQAPFDWCRIADVGDAPVDVLNFEQSIRGISDFFARISAAGAAPLAVGGDHTITLLIMRGMVQAGVKVPMGMIHFDAHPDMRDEYNGSRINCATGFRRAIEEGLIDPKRYIMIGIRSIGAIENLDWARRQGVTVLTDDDCAALGRQGVITRTREVVGAEPTFLSFDIDALNIAYVHGTQAPVPGELSVRDVKVIMRGLRNVDVIGADVVELLPALDPTGHTAISTVHVAYEILCLLAEARANRKAAS